MAVPKRKHSTQRKGKRRASITLKRVALSICPQCKQKVLPHHACSNCGQYKGKQVIKFKSRKKKTKKRSKNENPIRPSASKKRKSN